MKPGDSSTALHVAAHFNTCDVVAYLSAIVSVHVYTYTCRKISSTHCPSSQGWAPCVLHCTCTCTLYMYMYIVHVCVFVHSFHRMGFLGFLSPPFASMLYTYFHVHVHAYIHTQIHVDTSGGLPDIHVHVYKWLSLCVYLLSYIHVHVYTCTCTCMYRVIHTVHMSTYSTHISTCIDVLFICIYQDTCTVESRTCLHDTPLHIAARDGSVVGLEQLVGYGADVTATDSLGITPLHYVLVKKIKTPLSEWTPHLNQVPHGSIIHTCTYMYISTGLHIILLLVLVHLIVLLR